MRFFNQLGLFDQHSPRPASSFGRAISVGLAQRVLSVFVLNTKLFEQRFLG